MLGARRVPLLTVADKDKDEILVLPTIRFNIKLELPIESVSSELSFIDLNDGKNGEKQVPDDPFGREDSEEMEELKKIAEQFNSKYGGSTKKSKKRKRNIKDLVDRGEGYCEDSFVDNSEAYDEVVPWCLDTKHGGFYINEGVLDFIKNDDSDQEDQPKKKKEKLDDNQDGVRKKAKVGDQKKPKLKKKIKSDAEGLPKSENEAKPTPAVPPSAPALVSKSEKLPPLVVEAVDQSMVLEEEVSELEESFTIEEPNEDPTVAQLITELSCEVIQKVALARAAQPPAMAGDNQVPHIFNSNLLESLTRLHSLCQTRKNEDKHSVFERVAAACNCQKEQLYKKIKRHRMNLLNDEMNKKKEELKDAVARAMPALVEKYKHDLEESNKLKKESMMMMTTKEVHGSGDSEADEEGKTEAEKSEKIKRIMAPRRKFVWSMEIRTLLCEVVSLKMRHFDMAKIKSQTAEEHLRSFLDSSIRPLWPSGWIQPRALYKESRPAHMSWTGDQNKAKKTIVTAQVTQVTHQKIPTTQQQQQQQQQVQNQQQHHPVVVHKPVNSTPNPPRPIEDPIVINLDESDNEQSKIPSTPVNKHNKNVFTLIKEKQSSDPTKFEAKVHEAGHEGPADVHHVTVGLKANDVRDHKNDAVSGTNHSIIPMTQASQIHHQAKDLNLPQKNSLTIQDAHSRFSAGPATVLTTEGKEPVKQEHVFQGRFISSSKPFQSPNIPNQTGGNKAKPLAVAEDGNVFVGYQTDQVDLTEESPQTPRKRTVSQTMLMHPRNTDSVNHQVIVQSSDSTHNSSPTTLKIPTENSPKQPPLQRAVFDSCAQNQAQKNANRDGNAYHPQQPQSSPQLYQQQLLQQQYQQFQQQQQQRQQQMVKKSPKQDKFPSPKQPAPNIAHVNYSLAQQQQPSSVANSSLTNVKIVQQSAIAKSNEGFVQDHHQDTARARANEVSAPQRGFPSGAAFSPTEIKMSSFPKSPLKKVDSITPQQQGFANFQNLSVQSKQHLQQMIQQSQNFQQSIKTQQLHNNSGQQQQQFATVFRAQNFSQEGSSQQKN